LTNGVLQSVINGFRQPSAPETALINQLAKVQQKPKESSFQSQIKPYETPSIPLIHKNKDAGDGKDAGYSLRSDMTHI